MPNMHNIIHVHVRTCMYCTCIWTYMFIHCTCMSMQTRSQPAKPVAKSEFDDMVDMLDEEDLSELAGRESTHTVS